MRQDPNTLTPREKIFVDEYLAGKSITDAYIAAGYSSKTVTAAWANSSRLMARPRVAKAIAAERERLRSQSAIDRDSLVAYLTNVIFTPIGKIDENSNLMQSYTRTEGELSNTVRFQMVSKMDSVKHLTFLLGFDPPKKQELSADSDLKSLLLSLRGGTA